MLLSAFARVPLTRLCARPILNHAVRTRTIFNQQAHYRFFSNASKRVAVIGSGSVGSTIALLTMMKNVANEILMVDAIPGVARGQVLDLNDANIVNSCKVRYASLRDAAQANLIVITAGAKQRPGESRQELIDRNYDIMKNIIGGMQPIRKDAVLMIVSNPVDTLTLIAQNLSGLPRHQVLGSGTFLDTSRLTVFLSDLLNVSASCIHAYVLGEHGDSQFIAWDSASVAGRPLLSIPEVRKLDKDQIRQEVSNKAMDIIRFKGSTYYGIGACAASLCESILTNAMSIQPLSVYSSEVDTVISLPAKLGANGIEEIVPVPLGAEERDQFLESAKTLKALGERYRSK
ncbi:lactate dehydrogenase B [Fennellomyces sp. T-0311]|nr:lactate dehydrogenase B [Fennellomyces sp. T-0311]